MLDIESVAARGRAFEEFFALPAGLFLGHARRLRDHPLEVVHLFAQIALEFRELLLFLLFSGVSECSRRCAMRA